eukprot:TRINITY_DN1163_c0_g1_i1.p1 TRINITY_DN1163_c0_g1~~TRINITY_DN1163_c0_g1_i1.p1  ORF type:complete len:132 (+),score=17.69 TRINITY_DN1163_c0_g1_i1:123-518(+)
MCIRDSINAEYGERRTRQAGRSTLCPPHWRKCTGEPTAAHPLHHAALWYRRVSSTPTSATSQLLFSLSAIRSCHLSFSAARLQAGTAHLILVSCSICVVCLSSHPCVLVLNVALSRLISPPPCALQITESR